MVEAVAPKPVNVLTFGLSVETLRKLGVLRISVCGQLARSAHADLIRAATGVVENIDFSAIQGTQVNMNNLYETYREGGIPSQTVVTSLTISRVRRVRRRAVWDLSRATDARDFPLGGDAGVGLSGPSDFAGGA